LITDREKEKLKRIPIVVFVAALWLFARTHPAERISGREMLKNWFFMEPQVKYLIPLDTSSIHHNLIAIIFGISSLSLSESRCTQTWPKKEREMEKRIGSNNINQPSM
jgi:hypothetical protein